jgi:cell shape-determining protein MreC
MIAAHSRESILANPVDAGQGICGVVNDVAKKQTRIESLIDRRQRWPVCMDVGQQKNTHGSLSTHIQREQSKDRGDHDYSDHARQREQNHGETPTSGIAERQFACPNRGSNAGFID